MALNHATKPACTFIGALLLALPGCISVQAIEPVMTPPIYYQADVTVPVEFVSPHMIGLRCAERGAKFFGLPGLNSGACGDGSLVSMPDPCQTITGGRFADLVCRQYELTMLDSFETGPQNQIEAKGEAPHLVKASLATEKKPDVKHHVSSEFAVQMEFVQSDRIEFRCAERGAKVVDDRGDGMIACADRRLISLSNPCSLPAGGWYARTLCHEMAHANGWPANHSMAQPARAASESPEFLLWKKFKEAPSDTSGEADTILLVKENRPPSQPVIELSEGGIPEIAHEPRMDGQGADHAVAAGASCAAPAAVEASFLIRTTRCDIDHQMPHTIYLSAELFRNKDSSLKGSVHMFVLMPHQFGNSVFWKRSSLQMMP